MYGIWKVTVLNGAQFYGLQHEGKTYRLPVSIALQQLRLKTLLPFARQYGTKTMPIPLLGWPYTFNYTYTPTM